MKSSKGPNSAAVVLSAALAVMLVTTCAWPIDYAREQRWAQEITPAILVGEPVYLTLSSGHKFLAIYENPSEAKAAVIVVHGAGVHPDWGLINTLRSKLPQSGYATLSVQMPVLPAGTKPEQYPPTFPEATQRLQIAVGFLRSKGHARVGIVAHSVGALMSNHFLVTTPEPGVAAWASLGIVGTGEFLQPGQLTLPTLDLYGERDQPLVLAGSAKRAAVLRMVRGSAQIQIAGSDHMFSGNEDEMVRWVKEFFDRALAQ